MQYRESISYRWQQPRPSWKEWRPNSKMKPVWQWPRETLISRKVGLHIHLQKIIAIKTIMMISGNTHNEIKDFLIPAQYDVEVNTARAEAEKAYELQAATIQQQIQEQMSQVEIVERRKQIEIQEQEVARKEKALEASIKKPADAEKYRLEKIAEAERKQAILKAEGEAEAKIMKGGLSLHTQFYED